MRVLHLINVHQWTGPADYVIKISKHLLDRNNNVLVGFRSFYQGVFKDELLKNSIPFTEELKLPRGFKPRIFLQDHFNLKKIITDFSPDIIHCHNSFENIHCTILKNRNSSFKLVRTVYNLKVTKKKPFSRYILNKNDFIISVCSDYKNRLIKNQKIDEKKIVILNGFVDTDKFSPSTDSSHRQYLTIGMVARFQEKRGHRYLIKAFKKLLDNGYSNIRLVLAGRGETLDEMRNLCRELNIENFVRFPGYVKEGLPHLLKSFDIFVLLREGSDGTCRAVLEAMASGLPVVTVNRGALTDTVKQNINGLFIGDKKDVDSLYKNLLKLLNNTQLRLSMGDNSRQIALQNFSMEQQLKNYYNFYKNISEEKN